MSVSSFDEVLSYNPEFAKLSIEMRREIIEHIRRCRTKESAMKAELDAALAREAALREERDALQQRLTDAEKRSEMLEREFKKLRDVADGCFQIASSYSGCIDGVEEHGGDDHEDPSCAIYHRLYYAMFDADAALKPVEGEGS